MENGNCVVALRCINMHKLQQKFLQLSSLLWSWPILWCGCPDHNAAGRVRSCDFGQQRVSAVAYEEHVQTVQVGHFTAREHQRNIVMASVTTMQQYAAFIFSCFFGFAFFPGHPFFVSFGHGKSAASKRSHMILYFIDQISNCVHKQSRMQRIYIQIH